MSSASPGSRRNEINNNTVGAGDSYTLPEHHHHLFPKQHRGRHLPSGHLFHRDPVPLPSSTTMMAPLSVEESECCLNTLIPRPKASHISSSSSELHFQCQEAASNVPYFCCASNFYNVEASSSPLKSKWRRRRKPPSPSSAGEHRRHNRRLPVQKTFSSLHSTLFPSSSNSSSSSSLSPLFRTSILLLLSLALFPLPLPVSATFISSVPSSSIRRSPQQQHQREKHLLEVVSGGDDHHHCPLGMKLFSVERGNTLCAPIPAAADCVTACEWQNTTCRLSSHFTAFRGRRTYVAGFALGNDSVQIQCCASLSTITELNEILEPECSWTDDIETTVVGNNNGTLRLDPPLDEFEYIRDVRVVKRQAPDAATVRAEVCAYVVQWTSCDRNTMSPTDAHLLSLLMLRLSRTKEFLMSHHVAAVLSGGGKDNEKDVEEALLRRQLLGDESFRQQQQNGHKEERGGGQGEGVKKSTGNETIALNNNNGNTSSAAASASAFVPEDIKEEDQDEDNLETAVNQLLKHLSLPDDDEPEAVEAEFNNPLDSVVHHDQGTSGGSRQAFVEPSDFASNVTAVAFTTPTTTIMSTTEKMKATLASEKPENSLKTTTIRVVETAKIVEIASSPSITRTTPFHSSTTSSTTISTTSPTTTTTTAILSPSNDQESIKGNNNISSVEERKGKNSSEHSSSSASSNNRKSSEAAFSRGSKFSTNSTTTSEPSDALTTKTTTTTPNTPSIAAPTAEIEKSGSSSSTSTTTTSTATPTVDDRPLTTQLFSLSPLVGTSFLQSPFVGVGARAPPLTPEVAGSVLPFHYPGGGEVGNWSLEFEPVKPPIVAVDSEVNTVNLVSRQDGVVVDAREPEEQGEPSESSNLHSSSAGLLPSAASPFEFVNVPVINSIRHNINYNHSSNNSSIQPPSAPFLHTGEAVTVHQYHSNNNNSDNSNTGAFVFAVGNQTTAAPVNHQHQQHLHSSHSHSRSRSRSRSMSKSTESGGGSSIRPSNRPSRQRFVHLPARQSSSLSQQLPSGSIKRIVDGAAFNNSQNASVQQHHQHQAFPSILLNRYHNQQQGSPLFTEKQPKNLIQSIQQKTVVEQQQNQFHALFGSTEAENNTNNNNDPRQTEEPSLVPTTITRLRPGPVVQQAFAVPTRSGTKAVDQTTAQGGGAGVKHRARGTSSGKTKVGRLPTPLSRPLPTTASSNKTQSLKESTKRNGNNRERQQVPNVEDDEEEGDSIAKTTIGAGGSFDPLPSGDVYGGKNRQRNKKPNQEKQHSSKSTQKEAEKEDRRRKEILDQWLGSRGNGDKSNSKELSPAIIRKNNRKTLTSAKPLPKNKLPATTTLSPSASASSSSSSSSSAEDTGRRPKVTTKATAAPSFWAFFKFNDTTDFKENSSANSDEDAEEDETSTKKQQLPSSTVANTFAKKSRRINKKQQTQREKASVEVVASSTTTPGTPSSSSSTPSTPKKKSKKPPAVPFAAASPLEPVDPDEANIEQEAFFSPQQISNQKQQRPPQKHHRPLPELLPTVSTEVLGAGGSRRPPSSSSTGPTSVSTPPFSSSKRGANTKNNRGTNSPSPPPPFLPPVDGESGEQTAFSGSGLGFGGGGGPEDSGPPPPGVTFQGSLFNGASIDFSGAPLPPPPPQQFLPKHLVPVSTVSPSTSSSPPPLGTPPIVSEFFPPTSEWNAALVSEAAETPSETAAVSGFGAETFSFGGGIGPKQQFQQLQKPHQQNRRPQQQHNYQGSETGAAIAPVQQFKTRPLGRAPPFRVLQPHQQFTTKKSVPPPRQQQRAHTGSSPEQPELPPLIQYGDQLPHELPWHELPPLFDGAFGPKRTITGEPIPTAFLDENGLPIEESAEDSGEGGNGSPRVTTPSSVMEADQPPSGSASPGRPRPASVATATNNNKVRTPTNRYPPVPSDSFSSRLPPGSPPKPPAAFLPVPASTSSGGGAEDDTTLHALGQCCQSQSRACARLCAKDFDAKEEIKHILTAGECTPIQMTSIIQCFPQFYDVNPVRECCARGGPSLVSRQQPQSHLKPQSSMPSQCLSLCTSEFRLSIAHLSCVDHIGTIVDCYRALVRGGGGGDKGGDNTEEGGEAAPSSPLAGRLKQRRIGIGGGGGRLPPAPPPPGGSPLSSSGGSKKRPSSLIPVPLPAQQRQRRRFHHHLRQYQAAATVAAAAKQMRR